MDKYDGVDIFLIIFLLLGTCLAISIAVGFIKELIRDKKYNKIIIPLIIIVLFIAGGYQKISEIIEDAEREYEFKKTLPSAIIEAKKRAITYENASEFNIDSVPDDEYTYKPGRYTVGYSIEEGDYHVYREGGCSWILVDGQHKFFGDSNKGNGIIVKLREGEVLEVPEYTVIKMYKTMLSK